MYMKNKREDVNGGYLYYPGLVAAMASQSYRFNGQPNGAGYTLKPQVEALERVTIVRALEASKGSRREAAQLLGVSLRTLFYKLRRYELE